MRDDTITTSTADIPAPPPLPPWIKDCQKRADKPCTIEFRDTAGNVIGTRDYQAGDVIGDRDNPVGKFRVDLDAIAPRIVADLKRHGCPQDFAKLDQYWLTLVQYFARRDADSAIRRAGCVHDDREHLGTKIDKFGAEVNDYGPGFAAIGLQIRLKTTNKKLWAVRGWDQVPAPFAYESPIRRKEGEVFILAGKPHVALEEIAPETTGKVRSTEGAFVERPKGKGEHQANLDAEQMYDNVRGK